jgi:hypothetical protein
VDSYVTLQPHSNTNPSGNYAVVPSGECVAALDNGSSINPRKAEYFETRSQAAARAEELNAQLLP